MEQYVSTRDARTQVQVNQFIQGVYNWMALGLGLTGIMALFVASSPTMMQLIFGNGLVFFGLIIGELVLVFTLSSRVHKMSASKATGMFLVFAALNGATLSAIFMRYTASSIASTFFVCAGIFVACSIYGMTTKKDLTSLGGFMFMGLIGIILATLVNLFIQSSAVSMIVSYLGVFIFIGLTAYDTQKLKSMALTQPDGLDAAVIRKGSIIGALSLYLDFINMFLFLLHILGISRD
jgi:uncharacterized protein